MKTMIGTVVYTVADVVMSFVLCNLRDASFNDLKSSTDHCLEAVCTKCEVLVASLQPFSGRRTFLSD